MKALVYLNLVFSLIFISHKSYAQNDCAKLIHELAQVERQELPSDNNIFSETLPSTIANSAGLLAGLHLVKNDFQPESLFETDFATIVPLDIFLTLLSHYISLGKIDWLKKLTEGSLFGPKWEIPTRIGSNVAISSIVINSTWALSGIEVSSPTVLASIGLCLGVYSVLQFTKPYLFKTLPGKQSRIFSKQLLEKFPFEGARVKNFLQNNARDLFGDDELFEQNLVWALGTTLAKAEIEKTAHFEELIRYEKLLIDNHQGSLGISSYHEKIETLKKARHHIQKESDLMKLYHELLTTRSALRDRLIYLYDNEALDIDALKNIETLLKVDHSLSVQKSLELQRFISKTKKSRSQLIYGASVVDMGLAVGVAGSFLLYGTTKWAREYSEKKKLERELDNTQQ